jgi:hypothetical protein
VAPFAENQLKSVVLLNDFVKYLSIAHPESKTTKPLKPIGHHHKQPWADDLFFGVCIRFNKKPGY